MKMNFHIQLALNNMQIIGLPKYLLMLLSFVLL